MRDRSRREWFDNARNNLYGADDAGKIAFARKNAGFFGDGGLAVGDFRKPNPAPAEAAKVFCGNPGAV